MAQHAQPTNNNAGDAYIPIFSAEVRTGVYILGLICSVVSLYFMTFDNAVIGGFIGTAAGIITSGFGVAYNPLRTN